MEIDFFYLFCHYYEYLNLFYYKHYIGFGWTFFSKLGLWIDTIGNRDHAIYSAKRQTNLLLTYFIKTAWKTEIIIGCKKYWRHVFVPLFSAFNLLQVLLQFYTIIINNALSKHLSWLSTIMKNIALTSHYKRRLEHFLLEKVTRVLYE